MTVNTQDSNQEERISVSANAKAIVVTAIHRKTRWSRRLPSRDAINSKGCAVSARRAKERAAEDKNTASPTLPSLYYTSEPCAVAVAMPCGWQGSSSSRHSVSSA